ncbi:MAG TPA: hypothetical protein VFT10_08005 [Solirubrobacterales bacterium]|nr:hypothetical protein [Solirubrobacterales bacterium]
MRRAPAPTAFAIALAIALAVALAQGARWFHYDSGGYWYLSETFVRDGHFSLYNFENNGMRGYAQPLLYWALRNFGELLGTTDSLAVRVFNAAGFALIATVLAPRLAAIAWPQTDWNVTRRLVLAALLLAFWSGYMAYPLSDFPALGLGLLALIGVSRAESPAWLLTAGLAAGLAINIRPSYALLAPVLVALLVWSWLERRDREPLLSKRRTLTGAALLLGLAAVAIPQSALQQRDFGGLSPLPGSSNLTQYQYKLGLELQRYETYLRGKGTLEYVEPRIVEIADEVNSGSVGAATYLKIVVEHPIAMGGLFLRHIVNGFDQRYTTPYIEVLETERGDFSSTWHLLLRILGFVLVFLALLRVVWPAARRSLGPAQWRWPLALLVISLTAIPSAMDTRYVLPAYLVVWLLAVAPGWRRALAETRAGPHARQALALGLAAAAFYAVVVFSIVSETTDNLRLLG